MDKHPRNRIRQSKKAGLPEKPQRIAKVIARAGVCSRRKAEEVIREGRVCVNRKKIETPAVTVSPRAYITIDGKALPEAEHTRLWIFHKPRGCITTTHDPENRKSVFDLLPADLPRVISIGRLDINTEGLLLLTNDGELARFIEHPKTAWSRVYRARVYGQTTQKKLDQLKKGITLEGVRYGPIEAKIDQQSAQLDISEKKAQGNRNFWITLRLREGKNREIKRVLEPLNLQVNRLIRLSFGPFQLGALERSGLREVPKRILTAQLGEKLENIHENHGRSV